ncbi:MAG TPA: FtsX-like permease family protein, partial [Longimicrobiales bacterium]|nr:FtsX-like permease family protein [Longimicrobiales bacterium]
SKPRAEGALPPVAMYIAVSQNYFEAVGTPIIQGRPITRADHELNRPVVVVSESFVKSFLADRAIGEHISFGTDSTAWIEIVGVARDVRTFGLREDIRPVAYLPMNIVLSGVRIDLMHLIIRTPGDPADLAPAVRAVVKRIEPTAPILAARTMNDVLAESIADTSFTTTILTIAGLVALALGAIGLYGVIGYVVSQRTQEIGVRIALGAVPTQVRAMVLRQGLALAAIGVSIGLVAAVALTRLLEQLLFGVSSRDLATFLVVPLVMLAVSSLAAYVPARRAAAVSPLQALRME